jgi:hypothetical protein
VVTITLGSAGEYNVVAKSPVRVTGSSCDIPAGTFLASFTAVPGSPNTYTGKHGLWHESDCSPGPFTDITVTRTSTTAGKPVLTAIFTAGFPTVVWTYKGPPTTSSFATKTAAKTAADNLNNTVLVPTILVGLACLLLSVIPFLPALPLGIACLLFGVAETAATWAFTLWLQHIVDDPPDSNYTTVAVPVVHAINAPTVGLTPEEASALTQYNNNLAQEIAFAQAAITASNRASTAVAAGDQADATKQATAFWTYNNDLADRLDHHVTLANNLGAAFTNNHSDFELPASWVGQIQSYLSSSPLPAKLVDAARAEGISTADISSETSALLAADPNTAAGNVLDRLNDAATMNAFHALAASMRTDVGSVGFPVLDTLAPDCALISVITGPPKAIRITVGDAQSGLKSIAVITHTNAAVAIPSFASGTTIPVVVTATKINQALPSQVALQVKDVAGNTTNCDPLLATLHNGSSASATLDGAEHYAMVTNGSPGLTAVTVSANGHAIVVSLAGATRRLVDIGSALHGGANTVSVTGGSGGGSADVLVWDGSGTP